jgi:hypothetical protein
MKRKEFIQKAGLLAAGGVAAPYILPSGRLFARSNTPLADHVVLVMFAGGVRQQEAVLQRYLDDSQGVNSPGNIMYNLLEGAAPTSKIAYGTTAPGGTSGGQPIPRLLSESLQKQGTLFREMRAQSAGHYVGLNTLITGNPGTAQGLKARPNFPTIFEYLRKHAGYATSDCWFIGNTIGNSTPLLNSSEHESYGLQYGGNFFAAPLTFGSAGRDVLSNAKPYSDEELAPMYAMKNFLDQNFGLNPEQFLSVRNNPEERNRIKEWMRDVYIRLSNGQIPFPPVNGGGDSFNIGMAAEVLRTFKPKILVVNMSAVDGCHSNFTGYLQSLHRADHATGWLWDQIQRNIPEMSGKTMMIVAPECGRNLKPNPIQDENDWYAYDHSDANALRVWGLMAGPNVPRDLVVGSENNPSGRLTDIVPTIAHALGIKDEVMNAGLLDPLARSLFDRI